MNDNSIKETFDLINSQPYELNQTLSIELIGITHKISSKGYKYTAIHVKYFDHTQPDEGWKERFIPAKSGEAKLVVHKSPYISTDRYDVRSIKITKFWVWCNIDPVSSDNTSKEIQR